MDVAAICIGDELLDGRIRDRNVGTLGRFLGERGSRLVDAQVVPDSEEAIVEALKQGTSRGQTVVVTGGLGPTDDDRTRSAAAEWVGRPLQLDDRMLARLKERFDARGYEFTPNNRTQCYFPEGAEILPTETGTAAGFACHHRGTRVWFFPGVPREFEWFLENHFADWLADAEENYEASSQLTFLGIGESSLETRIGDSVAWANEQDISVSYLADAPLVTVRLSGKDADDLAAARRKILDDVGEWLVTEGGDSLAENLGHLLEQRGETVATAESCTGGWLSKKLTDIPGSSAWFEYGFVTYANDAKRRMLGVPRETLAKHGAVSPQTVRAMARGAREYADSEYSLAISGIAGPSGGTDDKPVGTVDFGLATPDGVYSRRFQFPPRGREVVRHRSVKTAAGLLIWYLEGRLESHNIDDPVAPTEISLQLDGA
jgi:nicotinamide-nucleotide amidase